MHEIEVSIPGEFDPLQRTDRFAEPMADALHAAGYGGELRAAGAIIQSTQAGSFKQRCCDFDVVVNDLERALSVIQDSLRKSRAPAGTTVSFSDTGEVLLIVRENGTVEQRLQDIATRDRRASCWQEGEIVLYDHQGSAGAFLLHALSETVWPSFRVLAWAGTTRPAEEQIRSLVATPPACVDLNRVWLGVGCKARTVNRNRVCCTGLVIDPQESFRRITTPGVAGVLGFTSWEEFDLTLDRLLSSWSGEVVHAFRAARESP